MPHIKLISNRTRQQRQHDLLSKPNREFKCLRSVMGFTIEHTNVYVESRFLQRNIQMFTLSNGFHNETYKIFTTEHTTVYVESRFPQ